MEERIGVFVCECGPNIADVIDIDSVLKAVNGVDGVVVAERYKLLCSGDGKEYLKGKIKENQLTHLVVAACSPKQHDVTFMKVCDESGLNPYLYQLANIREQCAWVIEDKGEATNKAIKHVLAALRRVRYHQELLKKEIDANPDVLVIGGGIAGMTASLMLAGPKRKVYLVEKDTELGGKVRSFERIFPSMEETSAFIDKRIGLVKEDADIEVMTATEVEHVLGFFGNFEVKVRSAEEEKEFKVGAVVTATGARDYDPAGDPAYGYGKLDNVITAMELEEMNRGGKIALKDGKAPSSVAIVHCVGRKEKGYCSEVCCLYSLKMARYMLEKLPGVKVTHLYSDLCIPGKANQRFFEATKGKGAELVRAQDVKVEAGGKGGLSVKHGGGSLEADMVVLAPAMEPAADAEDMAGILNISRGESGFFAEAHEKIGPVSTSIEGVYIVGTAQGPKGISETVVQAEAATGKIFSSLISGRKIEPEVKVSGISEVYCTGCKRCLVVCPYSAITYDEVKKISVVNEAICRGCGNCISACPSGAASLKGFTTQQIYQEIMEAVR